MQIDLNNYEQMKPKSGAPVLSSGGACKVVGGAGGAGGGGGTGGGAAGPVLNLGSEDGLLIGSATMGILNMATMGDPDGRTATAVERLNKAGEIVDMFQGRATSQEEIDAFNKIEGVAQAVIIGLSLFGGGDDEDEKPPRTPSQEQARAVLLNLQDEVRGAYRAYARVPTLDDLNDDPDALDAIYDRFGEYERQSAAARLLLALWYQSDQDPDEATLAAWNGQVQALQEAEGTEGLIAAIGRIPNVRARFSANLPYLLNADHAFHHTRNAVLSRKAMAYRAQGDEARANVYLDSLSSELPVADAVALIREGYRSGFHEASARGGLVLERYIRGESEDFVYVIPGGEALLHDQAAYLLMVSAVSDARVGQVTAAEQRIDFLERFEGGNSKEAVRAMARYARTMLLLEQGKHEDALEEVRKGVDEFSGVTLIGPEEGLWNQNVMRAAEVEVLTRLGAQEEALAAANRWLRASGVAGHTAAPATQADVRMIVAEIRLQLGEPLWALNTLRKAEVIHDSPRLQLLKRDALLALGREDEARLAEALYQRLMDEGR